MRLCIICFFLTTAILTASAQNKARQEMDQDRKGSFLDVKTYEKSQSFIRRDSTYYLGYMLEGGYLFFRANDELGFRKAAVPLQKALDKIEHDYDKQLRTRTNNYSIYAGNYQYQSDFSLIAYFLNHCYQNIEQQDKAMQVLYEVRDRDLQMETTGNTYNTMAWIFHRNRMYNSSQFSFLKNSIHENVAAANHCLDSALMKLQNDLPLNNGLYDPRYLNGLYLGAVFYKAMIYDYQLNIDSANYYYDLLIANKRYSSNNYATFKLVLGEMEDADLFYKEAESRDDTPEKKTKEYYYMRGNLNTYRGHPEEADSLLTDVLQKQGSTPGYGWHSLGLARAKHFEGLTAESQERANKAARFQEMHIGTTWGHEQYNLCVASLNYLNQAQFKREFLFEHDEWYFWVNPANWYRWVKYTLEIRHHKMLLASLVAGNPERDLVIYPIFASENLITFDEVWSVIDGFGNEYFIDIYEKRLKTDKRQHVKKYFRYFLGRLYLAEGKESTAIKYFKEVLEDPDSGDNYQTLLMARTYEGLAMASSGNNRRVYIQELYRLYPQLVPFTDLTMSFNLQSPGDLPAGAGDVIKQLRNTSIDFTNDGNAPVVNLTFTPRGDKAFDAHYAISSRGLLLRKGTLRVDESNLEDAGKLLGYRLFNIHKTTIGEQPPPEPPVLEKEKEKEKPV